MSHKHIFKIYEFKILCTSFQYGSASGAVAKHVQKWVRTLTKEELEFFALHLPKEPWQKLADICHFNSEQVWKTFCKYFIE